ncbi:MAG: hypothetical protein R3272_11450 [Candidatus Promineifilaceae bacterium]|nr:hypothetical protein [Candidatus Promineifilaceae bacterium]
MNNAFSRGGSEAPDASENPDSERSLDPAARSKTPSLIDLERLLAGRVFHCQAEVEAFLESLQAADEDRRRE